MKCPKCGGALKPTKQYKFYVCKKCHSLFTYLELLLYNYEDMIKNQKELNEKINKLEYEINKIKVLTGIKKLSK